ncbi:hypothetical protein Belba_2855 [Belliella baltica DSM 15883]|uniref:Uncharacterized protein n=1 Tax=Belliella baltica (strain DSM 15883 / CIP 108006 / LMG 21964 / BA134) TaxID=866536 RepID=I3Z819_BELBD|nr:hypothetical protein [Belliella baltica]AFL85387.1 hypothetical protein Belba_2855 [Belliella baltica DSM 15883]
MSQPIIIRKEDLIQIRFPKDKVLQSDLEIKIRDRELEKALSLGNLEHGKVKLTFLDLSCNIYQIETTIWALTDESICLKGDLLLPKRAVLSII